MHAPREGARVAGRHAIRRQAGRPTPDPRGGRCGPRVRAHRDDRRRARLVLRHVAVANQGRGRPADGRRRDASRAARPERARRRRHPRLLAGRGVRTGPTTEARGGNEVAGPRVARVRSGAGRPAAPIVHQTAVFEPVGLSGLLYWYALLPVHALIFGGLLRAIARRALSRS